MCHIVAIERLITWWVSTLYNKHSEHRYADTYCISRFKISRTREKVCWQIWWLLLILFVWIRLCDSFDFEGQNSCWSNRRLHCKFVKWHIISTRGNDSALFVVRASLYGPVFFKRASPKFQVDKWRGFHQLSSLLSKVLHPLFNLVFLMRSLSASPADSETHIMGIVFTGSCIPKMNPWRETLKTLMTPARPSLFIHLFPAESLRALLETDCHLGGWNFIYIEFHLSSREYFIPSNSLNYPTL